jgi:methylglutaconyl-CoA hydratase
MSEVLVKKEKFYYTVKLNRPLKHNAFTPAMIHELTDFFSSVEKDKFASAIILSGAGPSFCAGGDLSWMQSMAKFTPAENKADAKALFELFESAASCPIPIIGYFHGFVFGGGVGLAAICDTGVAEAGTKFCLSEVKLGLVPAVISSFVMNKMAQNKAREFMITGREFEAHEAKEAGLIEFVGRELEAQSYVRETLEKLGRNGPEALREIKKLLLHQRSANLSEVKSESIRVIADRRASDEGQEGLKSFLEKRKPGWVKSVDEDGLTFS